MRIDNLDDLALLFSLMDQHRIVSVEIGDLKITKGAWLPPAHLPMHDETNKPDVEQEGLFDDLQAWVEDTTR